MFRPHLTSRFVADALGLTDPLSGSGEAGFPFTTITTDSRKVVAGCLFIALSGEKFDGHDFIATALAQGAKGILCRRGVALDSYKEIYVYQVDDTLTAYRKLASAWRREFSIPVIAVAGSVGKTTTKEILAAILRGRWPLVHKTQGSQNGFVGIPMTLLELRPEHGAAVIEVGIDEIGAMKQHLAILNPSVSVLTAIGPEHLERLQDLPTVAREEGLALTIVAQAAGLIAISLDDPWIRPHWNTIRSGRKIAFTLSIESANLTNPADSALIGTLSPDGKTMQIRGAGLESLPTEFEVALPLPGRHNASNLLAAIAVASGLGLTSKEMIAGLESFSGADGRSELRELAGSTPVICDYYNANPTSTEAGLALLTDISARQTPPRPRWACLADMLELGAEETRFHRDLAGPLIEQGIENVLLLGPRMRALYLELSARGFRGSFAHFDSHAALAQALTTGVTRGDSILIKGSRGMKMETVWALLKSHAETNWAPQ